MPSAGKIQIGGNPINTPNAGNAANVSDLDHGSVPSRHREISNYRPQQLVREYPGGLTQFCNLDLAISIGLQTPLVMPG
jgi:hypothetical protein